MRRFTSIFKRDKNSDLSSSSSSSNSDHPSTSSWKSWIGAKRPSQKQPPLQPLHHDIDEDSQSDQEEEEEEEENDHNNLRIHIQNALVGHPQPNSPFVYDPHQPIFPRSSNNANTLPPPSSIRKSMLNSRLLARLNSPTLSHSELSSIISFASKSTPLTITHSILPSSDISRPPKSSHITSASLGIQRWITRPCFEDRFAVYLPTDSGIQCRLVTSSMPVAALEYPEYLDVMVDPDFDQSSPNPERNVFNFYHHAPADPSHTLPTIQSHDSSPEPNPTTVTPVHWRNSSTAIPSPLRIQHSPPQPITAPIKKDMVVTPAPKSTVKRVVRFAEDDEEDRIPLHMVRMKKKREDKVKFLQLEQLKRAKEEEEERKLLEQEALERERRRLAKEKEKREADKALYAEAIVAARMRREGHRTGTILPSNTTDSSNPLASSPSFTSLRNSERNKPLTDPRKLSSKPPFDSPATLSIPRRDNSDSTYYHHQSDSSPGSSRPPSIGHSPVSPSHHSRPPSTYSAHTSSSEEVRQKRGSKRNSVSVASVGGGPSSYHRPSLVPSYPSRSGSSQSIPQVPPLPDFVHDMPLLPPTAPFMKGSSYTRSSKSPGPSSTPSSRPGSLHSSSERVNQLHPPQTTRTSSRHHSSTAVPSSSSKHPTHERRPSNDSRTLSLHSTQYQQQPIPTSSWSQPSLSRGGPALPSPSQYLQSPSPWPALPQNGLMPMPMPMGYNPMNAYPVFLYPTGFMPTMQGMQLGSEGRGGWK
ncbi:hypothetical protein BYT27DRAFT_6425168 [Phlegmacium glaucopus]|nr:hypothetical protein BYT27DRAFT_6425168 [Phlegmacium glaucopus]